MEDGFEKPEGIYTTKGTLYGKEGYILLDKDGHLVSKDGKHINEEGFYVKRLSVFKVMYFFSGLCL